MIKNTLRDVRFEMKMDQMDFAEFLGVNKNLYNRWERQRGQPNLEWAMIIARKTGKPIETFIHFCEESEQN